MKKIGFIDYYVSEWHANNYPSWIKGACEELGLNYSVCYAWALKDVSEVDNKTTEEWCKEFGVEKCSTAKELCFKSDCVCILSPSNPEKHLELVKATFPYLRGKRVYVDKTFAPDLKTAKDIYKLAEEYGVTFFSTSALRYADEIDGINGCESAVTYGGGGNFAEYVIHQAEMVVKTMGTDIESVKTEINGTGRDCMIEYSDGRKAYMHYKPEYGFRITLGKDGVITDKNVCSDFFKNLIKKIVTFFEKGEVDFKKEQTLAVAGLREGAIKSELEGIKINIKDLGE